MPIPSHLVLDLDDTILDYSAPAEKVWTQLYHEFARKIEIPVGRLQKAVDESRRWYWSDAERFREGRLDLMRARRILVRDAFAKLGRADLETADELADAFTREREIVVRPFEGAIEALEMCKGNGSRMVLLTNGESSVQRAKIARFQLDRFFHAILIESETGIGKPDPLAFHAALSALGVAAEKAWMIGDDLEFDIRPAKALGMRTAWIHDPSTGSGAPADCTAPSLGILAERWAEGNVAS